MGACFHIAGVFCDNCRTGLSGERPRPLIFPMVPLSDEIDIVGPLPTLLATATEVSSLRAEVERLREELKAVGERARGWQEAAIEERAEVERLREAARQVHAFVEILLEGWQPLDSKLTEIHKITKGMVE